MRTEAPHRPPQPNLSAGPACSTTKAFWGWLGQWGSGVLSLAISAALGNSRRSRRVFGSVLIPLIAEHKGKQLAFAAAPGSPQSPSDPYCGYHAFLVQTGKPNDALSSPARRGLAAACPAQGAAALCVVGSCCPLPGIPSAAAEGIVSAIAREGAAHLRISL